jgi:hypothetical protein
MASEKLKQILCDLLGDLRRYNQAHREAMADGMGGAPGQYECNCDVCTPWLTAQEAFAEWECKQEDDRSGYE